MADFKDFIAGRASVIPLTGSEQVPIISGGVTKRTSTQAIANLVPAVEGPAGPAGADGAQGPPGPTAVSADAGNSATLGTDSLIYVPASTGTVAASTKLISASMFGGL